MGWSRKFNSIKIIDIREAKGSGISRVRMKNAMPKFMSKADLLVHIALIEIQGDVQLIEDSDSKSSECEFGITIPTSINNDTKFVSHCHWRKIPVLIFQDLH